MTMTLLDMEHETPIAFIRKQNEKCSIKFLKMLQAVHGHEPPPAPVVEKPVPPLPPIPDTVIAQAAKIAFPRYLSRVEAIQRATLTQYPEMTLAELRSPRRKARVVRARQIAMYLAHQLTEQSLPEIGRRFGGRDHTTVLHAVRKMAKLVTSDQSIADEIERIKEVIPE
jgi:hypothetical protein